MNWVLFQRGPGHNAHPNLAYIPVGDRQWKQNNFNSKKYEKDKWSHIRKGVWVGEREDTWGCWWQRLLLGETDGWKGVENATIWGSGNVLTWEGAWQIEEQREGQGPGVHVLTQLREEHGSLWQSYRTVHDEPWVSVKAAAACNTERHSVGPIRKSGPGSSSMNGEHESQSKERK